MLADGFLKDKWIHRRCASFNDVVRYMEQNKPTVVDYGFDTETTGLNIMKDVPFLLVFGMSFPEGGITFTMPSDLDNIKMMLAFLKVHNPGPTFGHNTKYDLHMITNAGADQEYIEDMKWSDSAFYARVGTMAVSMTDQRESMALKSLSKTYLDDEADEAQGKVKEIMAKLNAARIKVLAASLKRFPIPGEFTPAGKQKMWGKGAVEKFLKNPENDLNMLDDDVREVWETWEQEYPETTYKDIWDHDKDAMEEYAGFDVMYTLELVRFFRPVVEHRDQQKIINLEQRILIPYYRMERVGLRLDMEYMEASRLKVQQAIRQERHIMRHLAGDMDLTVGMHARIKKIFDEKFGVVLEKSDKRQLDNISRYIGGDAGRLADSINRLRTLEKWYKTYIVGIVKKSHEGRFHTQINQTGTVSGRVSSDAQQFPKEALKYNGEELFHPRKAFLADEGHTIAYADMSQVELRVQAHYTAAIKNPDTNLCRAYIPFDCRHAVDGHIYDIKKDKRRWDEKKDGQSVWLMEDGTPWTPTDTHSLTTHTSLELMGYTCHEMYKHYTWDRDTRPLLEWSELHEEEFAKARYKGKMINFMKNYAGGLKAAMESLGLDRDTAQKMLDGWTAAYPGVQKYQDAIAQAASDKGYVRNFFGRRYYIENLEKAYKLANYVIQGTCADLLKESIIKKDEFIRKNRLDARILLPVHDELQTRVPTYERHIYPELVRFMEDYERFYIPLTSDLELTSTNWAEKKVVKLDEIAI